ncbi:MAG: protein kinase [Muribaculaceae bacterium]|nr:protein kinase [Muribaculaceae bacterium]
MESRLAATEPPTEQASPDLQYLKTDDTMESGFVSEVIDNSSGEWIPLARSGSSRFEFFKVRRYGALNFVKRPAPEYRNDLVTTESLKKEFYIGYNLNHPSIVRYLLMEDGAVFEEYIDGLTLREMITRDDERLRSPEFIKHVCRQLLEATAYLHSQGVLHNDIKPENVMVSRIGDQVKLIDLGCATSDMWDATEGFTPACKAPEQGDGETNVSTDIYLIGRIVDELAPIAGVSGLWSSFVKKATADDVRDRFSSDEEALAALPDSKRQKNIIVTAVVGCVILLLAVGLYLFSRGNETVPEESASAEIPALSSDSVKPESEDKVEEYVPRKVESESVAREEPKSARKIIDQDLKKYVSDIYNKEIFPRCRNYAEMPDNDDKRKLEHQIFDSMQSVVDDVTAYAEKLAVEHPAYADYARQQANALLNDFQTKAALMQYPKVVKRKTPKEDVTQDPDSIY